MTVCEWAACHDAGTTWAGEWLFCDRHARQHEQIEAGDDADETDDLIPDRQIVDETAVARRCSGDRTVTLNRTEAFAAFARLEQAGMSSAEIAARLGTTQRTVVRWRNGHCDPITLPGVSMTTPTPNSIGLLLEQASGHGSAKVKRLGARIEVLLDDLRDAIKASEAEEEARQEVARLERQLADAKAKLRGGGKVAARTISPAREGDKRKEPMPCRKCGKACSGPQGRAAHERSCEGEAVAS